MRYRKDMELAFFEHFLKDTAAPPPAEATVFDTGANVWRSFDAWPPKNAKPGALTPGENSTLYVGAPTQERRNEYDEFISDPAHPVPFTQAVAIGMTKEYMTDDQRFVATRPDVLCYRTAPLEEDLTLAGPISARLQVSTSGTDSDWIVKLIDEFPPDAADPKDGEALAAGQRLGGFQMLVRSEVMRGRFRHDPATPKAFVPDLMDTFTLPLQDVLHTFKKGHRIQVQIHCSWFPLIDRNPQTFVPSIYDAKPEDFVRARQRVWDGTQLETLILPAAAK